MFAANSWYEEYQHEIMQAHLSRASGNEGMARVCARRAAGVILREYMRRNGVNHTGQSVFPIVRSFQRLSSISEQQKVIVNHFLITVDKDLHLPANIDLISDAEWLAHELLKVE